MRRSLPYTTKNRLYKYLKMVQGKKLMEEGKKVNLSHIQKSLAKFCSITEDGVLTVKKGHTQASTQVGLKMCEFFTKELEKKVSFEDIFYLAENENYFMDEEDSDEGSDEDLDEDLDEN